MYYLSHSVHFTQRCLYVLTWTPPQPASHAGALSPPLTLEQLKGDLRLWLQMLAQHVPKAKVLLVGTRDDGSAEYQGVRAQIEAAVDAEIEQLNGRVGRECRQLQQMERECASGVAAAKTRWRTMEVGRGFEGGGGDGSDGDEREMRWGLQQSVDGGWEEWQRRIAREVADGQQRVQMLRQRIKLMTGGAEGEYAQLQRVARDRSFTLDCLSGRGVAELQAQLSSLCSKHVPGMGEELPGWWQLALNALQEGAAHEPMLKVDAIERVRGAVPALSSREEHPDSGIMQILVFWADLGRIFVYGDFVLPDPLALVELIKPLLHHDPTFLLDDACSEADKALLLPSCRELSSRNVCMGYLRLLKNHGVLDRGLLPQLRAWGPHPSFHQAMLEFLSECHLVCLTGASDACAEVVVTARSRDVPAFHAPYPAAPAALSGDDASQDEELRDKHETVRRRFNGVLDSSDSCRVLFLVSRHHIGIISRLQAFIHSTRSGNVRLVSRASKDCLFMWRTAPYVKASAQSCCAVRVLPFCDDAEAGSMLCGFRKNGGPLSRESDRRERCGIVAAANDLALLAFMVGRVEDTLKRWSVCADCQCYVEGPPETCPIIRFDGPSSHDCCALPLSAVLTGNLWEEVVPGVQMRDSFPRQRRCAMFLSYASNEWENTGTRYACETIRSGFEEAALCGVWMDRADACHTVPWKKLVREGLQAANVYIVCMTPLYLTRPNCLTELNDILKLFKASKA